MAYLKSYKDLIVWQKSLQLVKSIYVLTRKFPKEEFYVTVLQLRRAVVRIPSTIAEGYGRKSSKEYSQFLSIAYGGALEIETQLIIAKELKFTEKDDFTETEKILLEVTKMLNSMTYKFKKLNAKP